MANMVKCTKYVCAMCKYRMRFGTAPSGQQKLYNFCCNYLEITGHSRIFVEGKRQYDADYCDKFERGKIAQPRFDWVAHTGGKLGNAVQVDKPLLDHYGGNSSPEGSEGN